MSGSKKMAYNNRRFYHWTSDFGEYLEGMADRKRNTLQIILLKMQGYSTKEITPLVKLTTGAIYARLDHLRKKLRKIL